MSDELFKPLIIGLEVVRFTKIKAMLMTMKMVFIILVGLIDFFKVCINLLLAVCFSSKSELIAVYSYSKLYIVN